MITVFAITIDLLLLVLASIPSCLCVLCNLWPCYAHWLSKIFMGLSPRSEMDAFPSGLAFVPDRHLGHLQVETSQAKFTVWGSFSASGWCTWGAKVHDYQSVAASSRNGLLPFPLCSCSSQSQIIFWGQREGHDLVPVYPFPEVRVLIYMQRLCFKTPLPWLAFGLHFPPAHAERPQT